MLRESPWYVEIEKEGLQKGLAQGRIEGQIEMLISLLNYRFGETKPELADHLRRLGSDAVRDLLDEAMTVPSLAAFEHIVRTMLATAA